MLQQANSNRWPWLAISLALHTGLFFALLSASPISLPVRGNQARAA
jgi:hypothetical protein